MDCRTRRHIQVTPVRIELHRRRIHPRWQRDEIARKAQPDAIDHPDTSRLSRSCLDRCKRPRAIGRADRADDVLPQVDLLDDLLDAALLRGLQVEDLQRLILADEAIAAGIVHDDALAARPLRYGCRTIRCCERLLLRTLDMDACQPEHDLFGHTELDLRRREREGLRPGDTNGFTTLFERHPHIVAAHAGGAEVGTVQGQHARPGVVGGIGHDRCRGRDACRSRYPHADPRAVLPDIDRDVDRQPLARIGSVETDHRRLIDDRKRHHGGRQRAEHQDASERTTGGSDRQQLLGLPPAIQIDLDDPERLVGTRHQDVAVAREARPRRRGRSCVAIITDHARVHHRPVLLRCAVDEVRLDLHEEIDFVACLVARIDRHRDLHRALHRGTVDVEPEGIREVEHARHFDGQLILGEAGDRDRRAIVELAGTEGDHLPVRTQHHTARGSDRTTRGCNHDDRHHLFA